MNELNQALTTLGWNDRFASAFAALAAEDCVPARVMVQERELYFISCARGDFSAEVAGRFRHEALAAAEYPAVGDWVVVRLPEDAGRAAIQAVLPRQTKFSRQASGERTGEQVVASNIDSVFLVSGLDGDFNLRRIERYLSAAWDSGANPVVVLNKADLCDDPAARLAEVEAAAPGAPVHTVSALTREGLEVVEDYLRPGRTIAFLGSSGVGKSTLINALLDGVIQTVQDVRSGDDRGRHTTTRRQLFVLEQGGLLLDTPGMRELQLWDGAAGAEVAFGDIAELAESCKFRDCSHQEEPGCAVLNAIESGELARERLENYHKLQREMLWLDTRRDGLARSEERKRMRSMHREYRKIQRQSRENKGET